MAKRGWLQRSFESTVLGGFLAAAFVVVALAATTWKLAADAREAARLVSHTYQVVQAITQARADTLQIEFSTQSYRISGDAAALKERNDRLAAREISLERLQALIADSPVQSQRWTSLRKIVNERIAIAKQVEILRTNQGQEAATAFVAGAPLRETRERIYAIFHAMDMEAREVLDVRTADQLTSQRVLAASGAAVAALLIAMLAGTFSLIRRQLADNDAAHRALIRSEENLATTLRSLGDAVLESDAQERITHMNPVAERLTGWASDEAQGQRVDSVFRLVGPNGQPLDRSLVSKVLLRNQTHEEVDDISLVTRSGASCPIGANAAPIRDESGAPQGVVLVFRDMTAERQAKKIIREQNTLLEQRVSERTVQLREAQEHLRSVMSSVPVMVAYVNAERRYVYANDQYRLRFVPDRNDITGSTVQEILGDARYAIALPAIDRALAGEACDYDWQPFADVWLAINLVPKRSEQGTVMGYYVLGTDVSERKQAESRIQALNAELGHRVSDLERATRAWKTLSAGNSAMLRATDERSLLDTMCRAIVDAGGYPIAMVWYALKDSEKSVYPMAESGYALGMDVLRSLKVTWADGEWGRGAIATAVREKKTQVVGDMQSDPSYRPWRSFLQGNASCFACPLWVGGDVIGALAIFSREPDTFGLDEVRLLTESADDLAFGIASLRATAERATAAAEMHRLTRVDALTGQPNGVHFIEVVTREMEEGRTSSESRPLALLQMNIVRLREINEALGLVHGDQLLRQFGARLGAAVPDAHMIARLRADEFALLLSPGSEGAAVAMVSRLNTILQQPFEIAGISLDVGVRIGIALYPDHGDTADELLQHADFAVNQAKRRELGFKVYDPTTDEAHPERLALAAELHRAIDHGDMVLYLQPKVDMGSGAVLGAEALVRWQHSVRGLIGPSHFIALAEHTGLIKNLTDWVIESAMRVCREAQHRGEAFPVAVNLSARNLRDETLVGKVCLLHDSWSVARGLLEFEITESTVMEDPEFALRVLHELRREGIPLYIDDFGTGYSSLSYLLKLPVEYVKIDQSFVRDMSTSIDSAIIVKSTIDLAHALGRKVVAEGVETQQDWNMLIELGCDIAQGYFIAKPMPSDDFQAWTQQFREKQWPEFVATARSSRTLGRPQLGIALP